MARCDHCGNDYDKAFSVALGDRCCVHCAKQAGTRGLRDRVNDPAAA